jgi:hypothetical protein
MLWVVLRKKVLNVLERNHPSVDGSVYRPPMNEVPPDMPTPSFLFRGGHGHSSSFWASANVLAGLHFSFFIPIEILSILHTPHLEQW